MNLPNNQISKRKEGGDDETTSDCRSAESQETLIGDGGGGEYSAINRRRW